MEDVRPTKGYLGKAKDNLETTNRKNIEERCSVMSDVLLGQLTTNRDLHHEKSFTEIQVAVFVDKAILLKENYCKDSIIKNIRDSIKSVDDFILNGKLTDESFSKISQRKGKNEEYTNNLSECKTSLRKVIAVDLKNETKLRTCSERLISGDNFSNPKDRNIFKVLSQKTRNKNNIQTTKKIYIKTEPKDDSYRDLDFNDKSNEMCINKSHDHHVKSNTPLFQENDLQNNDVTSDYEGSSCGLLSDEDVQEETLDPLRFKTLYKSNEHIERDEGLPEIRTPRRKNRRSYTSHQGKQTELFANHETEEGTNYSDKSSAEKRPSPYVHRHVDDNKSPTEKRENPHENRHADHNNRKDTRKLHEQPTSVSKTTSSLDSQDKSCQDKQLNQSGICLDKNLVECHRPQERPEHSPIPNTSSTNEIKKCISIETQILDVAKNILKATDQLYQLKNSLALSSYVTRTNNGNENILNDKFANVTCSSEVLTKSDYNFTGSDSTVKQDCLLIADKVSQKSTRDCQRRNGQGTDSSVNDLGQQKYATISDVQNKLKIPSLMQEVLNTKKIQNSNRTWKNQERKHLEYTYRHDPTNDYPPKYEAKYKDKYQTRCERENYYKSDNRHYHNYCYYERSHGKNASDKDKIYKRTCRVSDDCYRHRHNYNDKNDQLYRNNEISDIYNTVYRWEKGRKYVEKVGGDSSTESECKSESQMTKEIKHEESGSCQKISKEASSLECNDLTIKSDGVGRICDEGNKCKLSSSTFLTDIKDTSNIDRSEISPSLDVIPVCQENVATDNVSLQNSFHENVLEIGECKVSVNNINVITEPGNEDVIVECLSIIKTKHSDELLQGKDIEEKNLDKLETILPLYPAKLAKLSDLKLNTLSLTSCADHISSESNGVKDLLNATRTNTEPLISHGNCTAPTEKHSSVDEEQKAENDTSDISSASDGLKDLLKVSQTSTEQLISQDDSTRLTEKTNSNVDVEQKAGRDPSDISSTSDGLKHLFNVSQTNTELFISQNSCTPSIEKNSSVDVERKAECETSSLPLDRKNQTILASKINFQKKFQNKTSNLDTSEAGDIKIGISKNEKTVYENMSENKTIKYGLLKNPNSNVKWIFTENKLADKDERNSLLGKNLRKPLLETPNVTPLVYRSTNQNTAVKKPLLETPLFCDKRNVNNVTHAKRPLLETPHTGNCVFQIEDQEYATEHMMKPLTEDSNICDKTNETTDSNIPPKMFPKATLMANDGCNKIAEVNDIPKKTLNIPHKTCNRDSTTTNSPSSNKTSKKETLLPNDVTDININDAKGEHKSFSIFSKITGNGMMMSSKRLKCESQKPPLSVSKSGSKTNDKICNQLETNTTPTLDVSCVAKGLEKEDRKLKNKTVLDKTTENAKHFVKTEIDPNNHLLDNPEPILNVSQALVVKTEQHVLDNTISITASRTHNNESLERNKPKRKEGRSEFSLVEKRVSEKEIASDKYQSDESSTNFARKSSEQDKDGSSTNSFRKSTEQDEKDGSSTNSFRKCTDQEHQKDEHTSNSLKNGTEQYDKDGSSNHVKTTTKQGDKNESPETKSLTSTVVNAESPLLKSAQCGNKTHVSNNLKSDKWPYNIKKRMVRIDPQKPPLKWKRIKPVLTSKINIQEPDQIKTNSVEPRSVNGGISKNGINVTTSSNDNAKVEPESKSQSKDTHLRKVKLLKTTCTITVRDNKEYNKTRESPILSKQNMKSESDIHKQCKQGNLRDNEKSLKRRSSDSFEYRTNKSNKKSSYDTEYQRKPFKRRSSESTDYKYPKRRRSYEHEKERVGYRPSYSTNYNDSHSYEMTSEKFQVCEDKWEEQRPSLFSVVSRPPQYNPQKKSGPERCFQAVKTSAFDFLLRYYEENIQVYRISVEEYSFKLRQQLKRNFDRYLYDVNDPIYSNMGPQPRFVSEDAMIFSITETIKNPHISPTTDKYFHEFEDVIGFVGFSIPCYWCEVNFRYGQFFRALPVLDPIGQRCDTMYCQ